MSAGTPGPHSESLLWAYKGGAITIIMHKTKIKLMHVVLTLSIDTYWHCYFDKVSHSHRLHGSHSFAVSQEAIFMSCGLCPTSEPHKSKLTSCLFSTQPPSPITGSAVGCNGPSPCCSLTECMMLKDFPLTFPIRAHSEMGNLILLPSCRLHQVHCCTNHQLIAV